MGAASQEVAQGDPGGVHAGEFHAPVGVQVLRKGRAVEEDPATRFHAPGDVDVLEQGLVLHHHVIGGRDVRPDEDLLFVQAQVGLHRGAASLHTEKGEALYLPAGLEEGLGEQDRGHHRALSAPSMKPDFQHLFASHP